MKLNNLLNLIFVLAAVLMITAAKPLHLERVSFKVFGNCTMCKERIENSLKKDGIVRAEWDVETKILSLTYNPHMIHLQNVVEWITESGHDTEMAKANNEVYSKLPKCCQYRKSEESEKK
ncbi:MAG: heavy-metal-associated domain-containing protein [Cytophagaceae bacterium]